MQERRETVIDPELPHPLRMGLGYDLSPYTVAKLEMLAHAKFEIGRFTSDASIAANTSDAAALWNIARV